MSGAFLLTLKIVFAMILALIARKSNLQEIMLDTLFTFLGHVEDNLWSYLGFPMIMILGIYFSFKFKFAQIRHFPSVVKTFVSFLTAPRGDDRGVHPLQAFFACFAGCVGIGNIVAICTAVQVGGPGALFWIWLTAIVSMPLKYSEVYLGMRYRVSDGKGGYNGGPMYFLQKVFKNSWIPKLVSFLLCIYGIEVYQFSVMNESISTNFNLNPYLVTAVLLFLVIFASSGGVNRVGKISSWLVPLFIICYLAMGGWVLLANITLLPQVFKQVFISAFTGEAAMGAFVGSSIMLAASQGIRRGCYTSDVGVGYASIIHSESSVTVPERQASLAIFDIFADTFTVCTTSIMIILTTGVWKEPLHESMLVQTALGMYFPYMNFFMPFFLFLLGYTTVIAYFCVGLKCADFLSPKKGKYYFYAIATVSLTLFSFLGTTQAMSIMSITQALLLLINLTGIYFLRNEVSFKLTATTEHPVKAASEPIGENA